MLTYTICFIKKGDEILMLNREKASWMGAWNGVGGKIETGETPLENVLREVYEETGIQLENVEDKGIVTWTVDGKKIGGMYAFMAELSELYSYQETPRKVDEGILDWKRIDWILHPDNCGVATNIPFFLPKMLGESVCYEHHCVFVSTSNELVDYEAIPLIPANVVE